MIAQTIKLVAKVRDVHKEYNQKKEKKMLRQMFLLIDKAKKDVRELSEINSPYKWKDRFVFVSNDYLAQLSAAFNAKLKETHLYETSQTLDKALDWLFKNMPELRNNK
jgi:glucosamine 6-phosphate synthetase-like amidotransferase/phosphosugar isomerase protein